MEGKHRDLYSEGSEDQQERQQLQARCDTKNSYIATDQMVGEILHI